MDHRENNEDNKWELLMKPETSASELVLLHSLLQQLRQIFQELKDLSDGCSWRLQTRSGRLKEAGAVGVVLGLMMGFLVMPITVGAGLAVTTGTSFGIIVAIVNGIVVREEERDLDKEALRRLRELLLKLQEKFTTTRRFMKLNLQEKQELKDQINHLISAVDTCSGPLELPPILSIFSDVLRDLQELEEDVEVSLQNSKLQLQTPALSS